MCFKRLQNRQLSLYPATLQGCEVLAAAQLGEDVMGYLWMPGVVHVLLFYPQMMFSNETCWKITI